MPEFPKLPPVSSGPISVVLLGSPPAEVLAGWRAFADRRAGGCQVLVAEGPGDGARLRAGLAAAAHPLIYYAPGAAEYGPEVLAAFLGRQMPEGGGPEVDHLHLMTGYRAGEPVPAPLRALGWSWRMLLRVVFSVHLAPLPGWLGWRRHLAAFAARAFFGVRLRDPACPVRLLRREILTHLPIQSDGPMAHVELLAKANFLGAVMGEEVPLNVRPGPCSGDGGAIIGEARRLFNRPDFATAE